MIITTDLIKKIESLDSPKFVIRNAESVDVYYTLQNNVDVVVRVKSEDYGSSILDVKVSDNYGNVIYGDSVLFEKVESFLNSVDSDDSLIKDILTRRKMSNWEAYSKFLFEFTLYNNLWRANNIRVNTYYDGLNLICEIVREDFNEPKHCKLIFEYTNRPSEMNITMSSKNSNFHQNYQTSIDEIDTGFMINTVLGLLDIKH